MSSAATPTFPLRSAASPSASDSDPTGSAQSPSAAIQESAEDVARDPDALPLDATQLHALRRLTDLMLQELGHGGGSSPTTFAATQLLLTRAQACRQLAERPCGTCAGPGGADEGCPECGGWGTAPLAIAGVAVLPMGAMPLTAIVPGVPVGDAADYNDPWAVFALTVEATLSGRSREECAALRDTLQALAVATYGQAADRLAEGRRVGRRREARSSERVLDLLREAAPEVALDDESDLATLPVDVAVRPRRLPH